MRTEILGVGFDDLTIDRAASRAMELIRDKSGAYVVTPNPEIVSLCGENRELSEAVNGADMVLPDGIGIVYASMILKRRIGGRVPGIDFTLELLGRMSREGMSVFLYGAKPGIAERAATSLRKQYPGLVIAGCHDGYDKNDEAIERKIRESAPDFLMVCLGSPKQELWMRKRRASLGVGLMAGLGGSLDVFAGEVKRAPVSWQRLGLEWLYRLIQEPKRITRMIKLPLFLVKAAGERIRGQY